jgi:AhpD family alkylhydroperoxidase
MSISGVTSVCDIPRRDGASAVLLDESDHARKYFISLLSEGNIMKSRIAYHSAAPEVLAAMRGLETSVRRCGLEPRLLELVKLRASMINGCAYCIDMHTKDARALGEDEQRLYALSAWRETPFYSERERAALAWTEALTLISETHAPDDVYEEALRQFPEKQLVDLTLAIVAINGWNRFAIGFRAEPGSYESPYRKKA